MRASPADVVVVGAGVFGTTAALELRARGHEVTLLEAGAIPAEGASSTDVSKVVRMDYGSDVFYHELAEAALDGWDRWNDEWTRPLYHQTGFLILTSGSLDDEGFAGDSWRVLRARGYTPERIGGDALAARFPAWDPERYPDGYVSERAGWAESAAVVARLAELCAAAGVRIGRAVVGELVGGTGGRVVGVRTEAGDEVRAERVVLCVGAWTPRLVPRLAGLLSATAQPVLHFRTDDPESYAGTRFIPFAADIARTGWYGFPALADGRVKVAHHGPGATVDPARPGSVTDAHVARARRFLAASIPGLADAPLAGRRICMYCDSFDGDLWIDRDPEREGLVVAAGGSGHAFKFAPVLGSIIADAVEGAPNHWGRRFRWRAAGMPGTEEARFAPARGSPGVAGATGSTRGAVSE